jgi:hypothetical protein
LDYCIYSLKHLLMLGSSVAMDCIYIIRILILTVVMLMLVLKIRDHVYKRANIRS